jgi:hypothetical protein
MRKTQEVNIFSFFHKNEDEKSNELCIGIVWPEEKKRKKHFTKYLNFLREKNETVGGGGNPFKP